MICFTAIIINAGKVSLNKNQTTRSVNFFCSISLWSYGYSDSWSKKSVIRGDANHLFVNNSQKLQSDFFTDSNVDKDSLNNTKVQFFCSFFFFQYDLQLSKKNSWT